MTNKINQIYEEYWSYTAAFTDMDGNKFLTVLKSCIDFIDNQTNCLYSENKYNELQKKVSLESGITLPSVRKGINQLVKLGFLKPLLEGYAPEAVDYLNAKTNEKRRILLSKLVYHYSNFNNSMTKPNCLGQGQINFFIKTLTEIGAIDDRALTALMLVDIKKHPKGYLDQNELNKVFIDAQSNGFIDRKYNQISHLKNLLCRLNDLQERNNMIYFKTDAERLFGNEDEQKKVGRDQYLQRIFKTELEEESSSFFHSGTPKCMVEQLSHPVLIASHIKPYKQCNNTEAFDVNNGLLLSRNTDSLFDLGYITFDNEGRIISSKILDRDIVGYLENLHLNSSFINEKRMDYMKFHREQVFEKKFSLDVFKKYNIKQNIIESIAEDRKVAYKV